jgi:hypothetical protein
MKNKFLIGVITFFSAIIFVIVLLNIFDSNSKKEYLFDRKFIAENILSFEKKYNKMDQSKDVVSEYIMYVRSDNSIVEQGKKIFDNDRNDHKFYFSDLNFISKTTKSALLPNRCNIILCDKNRLFYTLEFKLFEYDFATKTSREIKLKNFKAFSLKSLSNDKYNTKFLCFGESFVNGKFCTGFHIIDIDSTSIITSKVLQNSRITSMPKNSLVYTGCFTTSYDKSVISYCCDKYSKIYFFDSNGNYIKELITKDNVPLPKILKNQEGNSFYSRGGTWTTNLGMFIKNDGVFVFSGRSKKENTIIKGGSKIIIDQYSYNTLQYVQSFKIDYNNLNSRNITNVFIAKDKIVVGFEFYYASFIFSKYI